MESKKAILLVRVSTVQQDYEAQIVDLKVFAKGKGYTLFKVVETKETGLADLEEKIGANEMFAFILENPEYKTVFATELSRLGRRQSVLHQIKEWFIQHEVQLYIKDSGFSLYENGRISVGGEMMFTLYGLFAESEIKQKLDRYVRKRKELMEKGLSIGGKLLFGYSRLKTESGKNTLVENVEDASIVRTLYNWYINGIDSTTKNPSIKRITIECIKRGFHKYTHSKRNVNKLLKEEAYTGFKTTHNKRKNTKYGKSKLEPEYFLTENKIKYPVIIERTIYDAVQKKLKANFINGDKETKHITVLAKLINCPSCGRKLSANYRTKNGESRNSYRCTSRTDAEPCKGTQSVSMNLIDSAVWSLVKSDLPILSKKISEINPNIELVEIETQQANLLSRETEIEKEISTITQTLNNLHKMKNIDLGIFIETQTKKLGKLDREKGKIQQEKAKMEFNRLSVEVNNNDIQSIIMTNLDKIEKSKELLKKYINSLVDEIDIIKHNVQYTVLKIKIKEFSMNYFMQGVSKRSKSKLYQYSCLIIDKRITRDIKLLHERTQEDEHRDKKWGNLRINLSWDRIEKELLSGKYETIRIIPFTKLAL